jgi:hypothetical protein
MKSRTRHLPPSRAEVRNEWRYTSPPLYAPMVWAGNTLLFNQDMLNYISTPLTVS